MVLTPVDAKAIENLIEEMEREAFYEGRSHGLYNHHDAFHTVKERTEMLNHKAIKEKIIGEIKHKLKGELPVVEVL